MPLVLSLAYFSVTRKQVSASFGFGRIWVPKFGFGQIWKSQIRCNPRHYITLHQLVALWMAPCRWLVHDDRSLHFKPRSGLYKIIDLFPKHLLKVWFKDISFSLAGQTFSFMRLVCGNTVIMILCYYVNPFVSIQLQTFSEQTVVWCVKRFVINFYLNSISSSFCSCWMYC